MTATAATAAPADLAAELRSLFRDELAAEVEGWERDCLLPRHVFERLTALGVFDARWNGSSRAGDVDVAAALARESTLVSIGAAIAISAHSEAFLPALRLCELGRDGAEDRIGCIALSEATSGSDLGNCATRARRSGDGWAIAGHKHYVSNFRTATDCVVFTRTSDTGTLNDFTLFLVPTGADGVAATPYSPAGARAAGTCAVDLAEVQVGDERRVGPVGVGLRITLEFLRRERLWAAVAAAAVAELAYEIALAYASRRRVAGAALRDHQAIAHRLVDLECQVAAARAIADGLVAAERGGAVSGATGAAGKLYATRVACAALDEAVQVMGARGFTDEAPMSRLWRDGRAMRIGGGADEVLREQVARAQRPGPLADHPLVRACAEAAGQAGSA
ncbi:MAG TPA: acyl-CoA dehydrogenase [Thermoleophilaceae bacterium]